MAGKKVKRLRTGASKSGGGAAPKPPAGRANKVRYVKAQTQTRPHTCHWPGCGKQCPPAMWGCKAHWFKLPKHLRDKIWAAYRPGQEKDMRPSREYLTAAREVQEWIRSHLDEEAE